MEDLTGCGISIQELCINQSGNEHFVSGGNRRRLQNRNSDTKLWNAEHPDLYSVYVRLSENGRVLDEQRIVTGIRTLKWSAEKAFRSMEKVSSSEEDVFIMIMESWEPVHTKKLNLRKAKILKEAGFNAIRSAHNPISKSMLEACDGTDFM